MARLLDAEALLVFVRDAEVDQLLPVPGLRQTLPDGVRWREFLRACTEQGQAAAELSLNTADQRMPAIGYAASADVVIVLVGTTGHSEHIDEFRSLLPLIGAAFHGEQVAQVATAQVRIAEESARHSEALARALDSAHQRLHSANQELREQTEKLSTANKQLMDAREIAESANHAKSDFLTTMSHELRTPLNAISGYVQLLELGIHGPLTDAQRDALARINRSQRHLLSLINDVLGLARLEAGAVKYHITEVTLREAIGDLIPLVEPQIGAKDLHLHTDMPTTPIVACADREKLTQILLNLLSNAIKFTDPGGDITIAVDEPGDAADSVVVTVTDTGRGIPADKLELIFDPFIQVDTGPTRTSEGTGLGLAISRDLARGMQGDLTAESVVGAGSVLKLRLLRRLL